mmetsp:Transcript_8576/g.26816  ORF Transcript_8576/g.26816 Transcript_8576/m.26816 type:complete len:276 (-) Transcript_8576:83-910(-)
MDASCSSCIVWRMGRSQSSNWQYVSLGTSRLPMRFNPFGRRSAPLKAKSPILCGARHFMRSSSMPPPVVTMTSTCLCCTRYRMTSRTPDEIMLDVNPRKIFAFTSRRASGDLRSSSSSSFTGSSDRRQARMRSISLTARPMFVAWKPVVRSLPRRPSSVRSMGSVKSGPWQAGVFSSDDASLLPSTACAAIPGMAAIACGLCRPDVGGRGSSRAGNYFASGARVCAVCRAALRRRRRSGANSGRAVESLELRQSTSSGRVASTAARREREELNAP